MEMVIYKYKRKPLIPNHDPQVPMPTSKQYIFWYLCNSTCCATMDSKKNQCPTLKTVILTQQGQVCTAATMILNTAQSIPIVYENQDHPEKNNNARDPLLSSTPVNTRLSTIHASHLTHWGQATHICVGKLTTIDSDNGLSPGRRQAIIWTIAGILLIGPLGTNVSEIQIGIQTFSFKKMYLKSRLRNGVHLSRPQCVKENHYHCPVWWRFPIQGI